MTTAEKIMMYKEKKEFIRNISKAFEARPKDSSVESINYEVYTKYHAVPDIHQFAEFLVVNFVGGAKSVARVSSSNNMSNFKVLGTLIDGDYCADIADYDSLLDSGFTTVPLDED